MAERTVEKEWARESWRGSPAELAELLSKTAELIAEENDDPETRISIAREGDDLSFESAAEFSEFARSGDRRVGEAHRVYAALGRHRGVHVTLIATRSYIPGMSVVTVTVRGADPVAVNGVSAEVQRLARRNGRRVKSHVAAICAWAVGLALTIPNYVWHSDFTRALSWSGTALMLAAISFGLLHPVLVPRFEVVDPDAPDSWASRVRHWLAESGKWLLAAGAGAVIYALAQKLIDG